MNAPETPESYDGRLAECGGHGGRACIPPKLAATILGHGASLIDEYHHIMASYLKDPETMRERLTARGVIGPEARPVCRSSLTSL